MIMIKRSPGRIDIRGHAMYDKPGKDIVCAAVSMLTYTLIDSLEQLTKDKIEYNMEDGNVWIKYKELSREAELLIDSFFIGLRLLEDSYSRFVRVE